MNGQGNAVRRMQRWPMLSVALSRGSSCGGFLGIRRGGGVDSKTRLVTTTKYLDRCAWRCAVVRHLEAVALAAAWGLGPQDAVIDVR